MPRYAAKVDINNEIYGEHEVLVDHILAGSMREAREAAQKAALAGHIPTDVMPLPVVKVTSRMKDGKPVDSDLLDTSKSLAVIEPAPKTEDKPPAVSSRPKTTVKEQVTYTKGTYTKKVPPPKKLITDPLTDAVIKAARSSK